MINFSETEQSLLDAAAVKVRLAEARLRQHIDQEQALRNSLVEASGELRATIATVLRLRGLNPDDYSAHMDAEDERIVVEATRVPAPTLGQ